MFRLSPAKLIINSRVNWFDVMETESRGLEVDLKEARKKVASGSRIMLFETRYSEVQLLSEAFALKEDEINIIDMNDFHTLNLHYGEEEDLKEIAKKFDESVIVCPHGNTSKMLAEILAKEGVKAYSLKGGIEGMLKRED